MVTSCKSNEYEDIVQDLPCLGHLSLQRHGALLHLGKETDTRFQVRTAWWGKRWKENIHGQATKSSVEYTAWSARDHVTQSRRETPKKMEGPMREEDEWG